MLRIGITGDTGFIGKNLSSVISHYPETFSHVKFNRSFFKDFKLLCQFVSNCDVIVHLAALSRHPTVGSVIENNISLTKQLIAAMTIKNVKPYLIFTSSIHDQYDTEYGQCKREENRLLSNWASNNKTNYSCIVLSNIFGPQCKPNYASFIATFCYKLVRNEAPIIEVDNIIRLTYIDNLTSFILKKINNIPLNENIINEYVNVPWDIEVKVSEVLLLLNTIKRKYILEGIPPDFSNQFEKNLYTTLISYYN